MSNLLLVGSWAKMWFRHGAVAFGGFIYVIVQNDLNPMTFLFVCTKLHYKGEILFAE